MTDGKRSDFSCFDSFVSIGGESAKKQEKPNLPNESKRNELQISKYRAEIIDKISKAPVTIITAPTGSGKTTQVPQFIYDDCQQRGVYCNILISQPKKIAAITVANRVAVERDVELGKLVGYQVGLSKKTDEENMETKLLFCTTGIIVQKLVQEREMNKYSHIILDEIHDRDIDMDFLLIIVRDLLLANSADTRIILMSATVEVNIFFEYFTFNLDEGILKPELIQLKTPRPFKIKTFFLDDLKLEDYAYIDYDEPGITLKTYELAKNIVIKRLSESKKSILVFLPGIHEINQLYAILKNEQEVADSCLICFLHSSLSAENQRLAFKPANKPKIILSTNIAESSVTITGPEVDCVIDFCLSKILAIKEGSIMASLTMEWAARSCLHQRSGRTGRVCDGVVYHLIEQKFYQTLSRYPKPQMKTNPLENVILRIKLLDFEPPLKMLSRALTPPLQENVINAVKVLKELGGIERVDSNFKFHSEDGKLTYVGRIMANLPLDARITKFIIVGYLYSVLDEAIIIGAGLNIGKIFRTSFINKLDDYSHKLTWADQSESDIIAIINAYKLWQHKTEQGHFTDYKIEENWCEQFHLERKNLHEMRRLVREISRRLEELKMVKMTGSDSVTWTENEKPFVLKICFAAAFIPNYFIAGEVFEETEKKIYKELGGSDPKKTIYFKKMEKNFVGEVYEAIFKQKLIECGIATKNSEIKVKFDRGSSKVFVEFSNDMIDSKNEERKSFVAGNISAEVYKAVLFRRLSGSFHINVMDSFSTLKYAKDNDILITDDPGDIKNLIKHPKHCVLPLTCVEGSWVVVSHIEHCGKFFLQPIDDEILKKLENICEDSICHIQNVELHQILIAHHENIFKRAKVMNISKDIKIAKCFMFDYGITANIEISKLYNITEEFSDIFDYPERCFEATLSGIEPSHLKCPRGKWTIEAINFFKKLALGKECYAKVYSVVEDIASVELVTRHFEQIETFYAVNEALVHENFAHECDESYPSKIDHAIRKKNQKSVSKYGADVEFAGKINKLIVRYCSPPPMVQCDKKIFLQGPLSPLETKLSPVLHQSRCTEVIVDPLSVNSVILISDPGSRHGRLLVAANMTKNRNGIVIHETSLMPDIKGLPVLLAMMFSPEVTFGYNKDRTRFEYIKFGLGFHNMNCAPFFSQHDTVLPVNILLTEEDFIAVNRLRFLMSYLLMTQPTEDIPSLEDEQKAELMQKIKDELFNILGKKRLLLPTSYVSSTEKWCNYPDDEQKTFEEPFIDGGTYHLIKMPLLSSKNQETIACLSEKLKKVEQNLKISSQGGTKYGTETFICPLCKCVYNDKFELELHFLSKVHLDSVYLLTNEGGEDTTCND